MQSRNSCNHLRYIALFLCMCSFYSSFCNASSFRGHSEALVPVPAYYQCGGLTYTGNIVCVDGYYCAYNSPHYSQCIPITPTTIPTQKPTNTFASTTSPSSSKATTKAPVTVSSILPSISPTLSPIVKPSASPTITATISKPTTTTTKLPISSAPINVVCTNDPYRQCGGVGFTGATCCPIGTGCISQGSTYSSCIPVAPTPSPTLSSPSIQPLVVAIPSSSRPTNLPTSLPVSSVCVNDQYRQCGGVGFTGATCCPVGTACTSQSSTYSSCVPVSPTLSPTLSGPSSQPAPTGTPPLPPRAPNAPVNSPPVANARGTCIREDFNSLNFQYFTATSCAQQMSILPGGYLQMQMVQSCSAVRIDSVQSYQNAYVEASVKIGGQGPDFSGVIYAFYSSGDVQQNGNHANEIDVEILGKGNRPLWFQNSAQLGIWDPNYPLQQYVLNDRVNGMADGFVKYAFKWNYGTVDFFINDQKVYSSSSSVNTIGYTQPEKVIFSLWDGTPFPEWSAAMNWGSPQVSNFRMIIDYITICT